MNIEALARLDLRKLGYQIINKQNIWRAENEYRIEEEVTAMGWIVKVTVEVSNKENHEQQRSERTSSRNTR